MTSTASPAAAHRRRDPVDLIVRAWSWCGLGVLATFFLGLLLFLVWESVPALRSNLRELLVESVWHFPSETFGAASMLFGTVIVTAIAVLIAAPLALATAVMLSELLPARSSMVLRTTVELLAGIPSVVYGLIGVLYLVPFVQDVFGSPSGDTLLTAGLLLAVMILPTATSLSEGALRSVPAADREAARALGLDRAETTVHVVLRQAWPGLVSALLLGLGRAAGETIAVFLVIGRADGRLPGAIDGIAEAVLHAGQTVTSKLGGSEINIAYGTEQHWSSLIALGLLLFLGVMALSVLGESLRFAFDRGGAEEGDGVE